MLAFGESAAVASGATFSITVPLGGKGRVIGVSLSSPGATQAELQATVVQVGSDLQTVGQGGAAVPWQGIANSNGSTWYYFRTAKRTGAQAAVVVQGINGNAGAQDVCVAVEYEPID